MALIRRKQAGALLCSVCLQAGAREQQLNTPSGITCAAGHGDADGIDPASIEPPKLTRRARVSVPAARAVTQAGEQHDTLHTKLRPRELAELIGQQATVKSVEALFTNSRVPHCFIFTGPSGVGKTTLARIVARMIGCSEVIEHDAGRFGQIDTMRVLAEAAQYAGLGENAGKFIIIDEAHRIGKAAFDTLLKVTEEPPPHLYWAFCSTEPERLPQALHTRSHVYALRPVPWEEIAEYLTLIVSTEQLDVLPEFIDIAARKAAGSVRQALMYVSKLQGITEKEDALELLDTIDEQNEGAAIELARMLISGKGATWANAKSLLSSLIAKEEQPETVRRKVFAYASKAALGNADARKCLATMSAFSVPFNQVEEYAPLVLAVGSLLIE